MQVAYHPPSRPMVAAGKKALRKHQKPIDALLVKTFWARFSHDDRLRQLVYTDRKLVDRAFAIQEELRRREQECFSKGIAFKNVEGKEVMSISLACFGFQWNENGQENVGSPIAFFAHGALMSLCDEQFFSYLDQRLGAAFSAKRPMIVREQWCSIFDAMPNTWNDFELLALKLVEQTILWLYFEAEEFAAMHESKDDVIDDSWIDDEVAKPQPTCRKKQPRKSPQNGIANGKSKKSFIKSGEPIREASNSVETDQGQVKLSDVEDSLHDDDLGAWSTVSRKKQPKTFSLDMLSPASSEASTTMSLAMSSNTSDSMSEVCSTDNVVSNEMPAELSEVSHLAAERGWWIQQDVLDGSLEWYFQCPQFKQDVAGLERGDSAPSAAFCRAVTRRTFIDCEVISCVSGTARVRSLSADL